MLLKILLVVAALVILLLVVIALQSSEMRISRSATIDAPVEAVFAEVNDLHRWEAWSPYAKLDPAMKTSYEGAPAGVGASYTWSGNSEVGEGRTTITESRPGERVGINLEMIRPFPCQNDVVFTFEPQGKQTVVTWTMTGKKGFGGKAIGLVMSMDKMVGGQFEQGLASLKRVVETADPEPQPAPPAPAAT